MKKQLLPFLFLLITLLLAFKTMANEKLEQLKDQAFKAIDEKEYSQAREAFNALIRDYPDSAALLGLCYNNLGAIDIREGFNTRAIDYTQKALEQYRKTGIDTLIGECMYNNGLVYKQLGQYEAAVESLLEAIELLSAVEQQKNRSKSYNVLGNLHRELGELEKALSYNNKAYAIALAIKDSSLQAQYLNNRASTYIEMEYWEEAKKDLLTSLGIKNELKLIRSTAFTYYHLGRTAFLSQQWNEALDFLRMATKIHEQYNNQREMAYCYNLMGKVFIERNKLKEAESYLKKAEELALNMDIKDLLLKNYEAQEELFSQKGNYQQAIDYTHQYIALYKTILNLKKQNAIEELEIKYEVEKKENENKLLYQEAEIQLLKIKQQESSIENWKLTSLTFILLVIFTALLGYRYYQVSQKEKKLADREKHLNQEQHHRIKNHLQALEGLLSFQQRKIEKGDVQEVIQESKNRITVVSQLHRNFYQNENSSSLVQLDTYLRGIIENLQLLFNRKEVQLIFQLSPVQLAADKVLPLGLICNEVVNNAFKYGLSNKDKAVLEVQLRRDNKQITLSIKDNGPGYDPTKNPGGLGSELIQQLTRQLDGKMTIQSNSGTSYTLVFSI